MKLIGKAVNPRRPRFVRQTSGEGSSDHFHVIKTGTCATVTMQLDAPFPLTPGERENHLAAQSKVTV